LLLSFKKEDFYAAYCVECKKDVLPSSHLNAGRNKGKLLFTSKKIRNKK
jgi:hypothetical protein